MDLVFFFSFFFPLHGEKRQWIPISQCKGMQMLSGSRFGIGGCGAAGGGGSKQMVEEHGFFDHSLGSDHVFCWHLALVTRRHWSGWGYHLKRLTEQQQSTDGKEKKRWLVAPLLIPVAYGGRMGVWGWLTFRLGFISVSARVGFGGLKLTGRSARLRCLVSEIECMHLDWAVG